MVCATQAHFQTQKVTRAFKRNGQLLHELATLVRLLVSEIQSLEFCHLEGLGERTSQMAFDGLQCNYAFIHSWHVCEESQLFYCKSKKENKWYQCCVLQQSEGKMKENLTAEQLKEKERGTKLRTECKGRSQSVLHDQGLLLEYKREAEGADDGIRKNQREK